MALIKKSGRFIPWWVGNRERENPACPTNHGLLDPKEASGGWLQSLRCRDTEGGLMATTRVDSKTLEYGGHLKGLGG